MKGRLAWLLACALLLAGALLARGADSARWDWQPGLALVEPWRAWTAALLHWSPLHLQMNLMGLGLLALLGWRAPAQGRDVLAWAVAWPLTQVGLLLQPALRHYAGLSGVLHAGLAILAWRLCSAAEARQRRIGLLAAAGLLLKLLSEQPWAGAAQPVPGWDFALAPMAHVSGALAGLCGAALATLLTRPPRRTPSP